MNRTTLAATALALGLAAPTASAGPLTAAASYTAAADGSNFDYTITLANTSGSDVVGTFWFAWVPGQDFMNVAPVSVTSPAGWQDAVTHGGSADGFAIQWKASSPSASLPPGDTLSFGFTSSETPAQLAGNSPFHPSFPETTAFVYSGAPLQGDSDQFLVSPAAVPEPSTLMLTGFSGFALFVYNRLRRRRGA